MSRFNKYLLGGIIALLFSSIYFLKLGYFDINLLSLLEKNITDENLLSQITIVKAIRLPRILTGALTGAILSLSGVIFQAILFNPLADSYILGIASGASFGASLAIFLGISFLGEFSISAMAFIFGTLSLYFVLLISKKNDNINSNSLILSGVIVSSFFSAGVSFLQFMKGDSVESIMFWLMGSFSSKAWIDVKFLAVSLLIGVVFSLYRGREINILSLGDRVAKSNGVNVRRVKLELLLLASFLSAVAVSISGVIGFIGLMIPHLMRMVVGSDAKKLIPLSVIYGALITSLSDNLIRVYSPQEFPIGIVTALLGAPFFIFIFRKKIMGRG